jgi:hypothetical protein
MPKKATAINIQTQFAESQFMFQPFTSVVPLQEAPLAFRAIHLHPLGCRHPLDRAQHGSDQKP